MKAILFAGVLFLSNAVFATNSADPIPEQNPTMQDVQGTITPPTSEQSKSIKNITNKNKKKKLTKKHAKKKHKKSKKNHA